MRHILLITRENVKKLLFLTVGISNLYLTNNRPIDFGADPHHDPHLGIFVGIFPFQRSIASAINKYFAGSAVLAEVCAIRIAIFLHCAPASGAVYCNRPCLCVCGGRAMSEPYTASARAVFASL